MRISVLLIILAINFTPFAFGVEDPEKAGMGQIFTIFVTEPDGDEAILVFERALLADADYLNEKEGIFAEYLIEFNCDWPEEVFDQIRNFNIPKEEQDILIQIHQNAHDECIRNQTIVSASTNEIIETIEKSQTDFTLRDIAMMTMPIAISVLIALIIYYKTKKR